MVNLSSLFQRSFGWVWRPMIPVEEEGAETMNIRPTATYPLLHVQHTAAVAATMHTIITGVLVMEVLLRMSTMEKSVPFDP